MLHIFIYYNHDGYTSNSAFHEEFCRKWRLEEKVHKVRNNGSVFTKAYRITTGDEIIHWLVILKKS